MQLGFVLHRRPYRETSLLVDLFTEHSGYIRAVCRGGQRKSLAALMQPFYPLTLSFKGQGELVTLLQTEPRGMPHTLTSERLYAGLYVNELLVRLLPIGVPCPELFSVYQSTLIKLADKASASLEPMLRQFEFILLTELGVAFDFQHDAHGVPIESGGRYVWYSEQGFCRNDSDANGISGDSLLEIGFGQLNNIANQRVAKQLCRQALSGFLGKKPLKSRELFAQFLRGKRR
ncbi:DNA repair protein RecO [Corallincola platygyrae]|uniref:DNA repair protein RecO n=1 Tax=Corallincola platygyrae TaxID=1193278 RepID=A0ABW4XM04_9GAMM